MARERFKLKLAAVHDDFVPFSIFIRPDGDLGGVKKSSDGRRATVFSLDPEGDRQGADTLVALRTILLGLSIADDVDDDDSQALMLLCGTADSFFTFPIFYEQCGVPSCKPATTFLALYAVPTRDQVQKET